MTDQLRERFAEELLNHFHPAGENYMRAMGAFDAACQAIDTEWQRFDKDDNTTWPSTWPEGDDVECWIMVKGQAEPEHEHWDPANCGAERGWSSIRADYVTHWMPIEVPGPPK